MKFIPLLFIPTIAMAQQQSDPASSFVAEYNAVIVANQHAFQAFGPFVNSYQALLNSVADAEAQKQTLIEWLKEAQRKEVK